MGGLFLELLSMFDGNVPSLIVVACFVLIGMVAVALINNGYLSRMLKRRGKGSIAERMGKIEDGFVPDLGDVLSRIDGKLDAMGEQMSKMDRRLNHVDKSALMGVIYNGDVHVIDRLRAFVHYLKLGGNGTVLDYAFEELVKPNRREWTRALDESRMLPRCDKFDERTAEIGRRLRGSGP